MDLMQNYNEFVEKQVNKKFNKYGKVLLQTWSRINNRNIFIAIIQFESKHKIIIANNDKDIEEYELIAELSTSGRQYLDKNSFNLLPEYYKDWLIFNKLFLGENTNGKTTFARFVLAHIYSIPSEFEAHNLADKTDYSSENLILYPKAYHTYLTNLEKEIIPQKDFNIDENFTKIDFEYYYFTKIREKIIANEITKAKAIEEIIPMLRKIGLKTSYKVLCKRYDSFINEESLVKPLKTIENILTKSEGLINDCLFSLYVDEKSALEIYNGITRKNMNKLSLPTFYNAIKLFPMFAEFKKSNFTKV